MKELYIAGGCFWGVQKYYSLLKGVSHTECGYANGNYENPTYNDLLTGKASHAEVVHVVYEPTMLSLEDILDHFLRFVDPYSLNRQGNDIGLQYRSGLYFTDPKDKPLIKAYIRDFEQRSGRKTVIEVDAIENYSKAEEEHQHYLDKNPFGYCHVDLSLIKEEEKK